MSPKQRAVQLIENLLDEGVTLTPKQAVKIAVTIHDAMQDAWEIGNGMDNGVPFIPDYMESDK